jgi:hypothetical protein
VFSSKIVNHVGCRGNTAQGPARWWHPVAISEAKDVLNWVMHPALYHQICMVIEIASKLGVFFALPILFLTTT